MENIPDREFSGVETGGKLRIENQKNQEIMESYLLHDANASSNFKIMMMIQKEGMKGYGIYWMILEFLRVQNGYKADVRILPVLARKMRVTVATLKRIIFDSGLFEVNNTTFSSPGLTRRMGPLEAKREANRESGRRGGLANQQRISHIILIIWF